LLLGRLLGPGAVFFDVGAHVGFYSLMASRRVGQAGRVVAFEPNPRNIDYLRRHVALNTVTNVEIVEAAVSSSDGWVGFEAPGDSSMGQVSNDAGTSVRSVSLDAWAAAHNVLPTVMKIDVEGHDPLSCRVRRTSCRACDPRSFSRSAPIRSTPAERSSIATTIGWISSDRRTTRQNSRAFRIRVPRQALVDDPFHRGRAAPD
jgi:FkbM family methyltransferase